MLKVLTSYKFGLTVSGAAVTSCFVSNRGTKHTWILAGVSGLCTFGTFLLFRRWCRPLAYRAGYSKADQITTARDWKSALSVITSILDEMDAIRHSRTGFVQTYSHFTNLLLLVAAESVLKSSDNTNVSSHSPFPLDTRVMLTYCKYANAAYGYVFCRTLGLISVPSHSLSLSDSDKNTFFDLVGRRNDQLDIIYTSTNFDSLYAPKHYLLVDHIQQSIVLSIRGTSGLFDALTDLKTHLEEFHEYETMAHAGVLQSARNIVAECNPILITTANRYPDYKLVVTGHSLAGAVGTLVTLILMSTNAFSKDRISCFAFGPPPVVPVRLNIGNIICVINGSDVVPRLSLASIERLLVKLEKLDALLRQNIMNRWVRWKATSPFFGFHSLTHTQQMTVIDAISPYNLEASAFPRLYHVGLVFHIHENTLVHCADHDHLMDIQLDFGAKFVISHLPNTYQRTIASIKSM